MTLLDIDFDNLPTGVFDISGPSASPPTPNPLLPEMTRILSPASADANIVDRGSGNKYFTLHSPSADTKAVFTFEPVASGTVTIEFKWLPDPSQNSASIAIVGGVGDGSAASDCAFTIMKTAANTISFRTGGAANNNTTAISGWSAGTWIDVKVEMNVAAQTYKLWVNGVQLLFNASEDIPYRYPISTANGAIWGITAGKANGVNATVGIDDIKVTVPVQVVPSLIDVDFNSLSTGVFDITGPSASTPTPNPLLPELSRILSPASADASIVDRGSGDKYFTLHSPSADTKALFTFDPVTSGRLTVEFKWLPDPSQSSASIAIIGGSGDGSAASDCAFTIMKTAADTISFRTGGAANNNTTAVSGWSAGTWIDVKVEMNVAAQTYKLWVNGTQLFFNAAEDIPYRYPISTANGAIWGVTVGKANGVNATVGVDDIKVTAL